MRAALLGPLLPIPITLLVSLYFVPIVRLRLKWTWRYIGFSMLVTYVVCQLIWIGLWKFMR